MRRLVWYLSAACRHVHHLETATPLRYVIQLKSASTTALWRQCRIVSESRLQAAANVLGNHIVDIKDHASMITVISLTHNGFIARQLPRNEGVYG